MKNLAFGQWTSSGLATSREQAPAAGGKGRAETAYMAMSDYLLLTTEAPEGGREDLEAWVSKNLPRFFPDEPDRHPFDILPRARGPGHAAQALFTSADCLAEYRNAFPELPLVSLITAFRDREGDFARVLAMPGWIEWASRESGLWTLGQRVEADGSFRAALSLVLAEIDRRPEALPVQLIYHPETERDLENLPDSENILFLPFDEAFDPRRAKRLSHFDRAARKRSARVAAIAALCAAACAFAAANVFFLGLASSAKKERAGNLAALRELKAVEVSDRALLSERDALLDGRSAAASFPSAQSLLSALSAGLGPAARLIDLSQENGAFTANLESPNALASFAALEGSGSFGELKISGIKATGSGERFRLTGRYREKR